ELKKGETLEEALKMKFGLPKSKQARERKEKEGRIVDEEAVKALEQKIAKPLYGVNVRLVASAPTPYRAMELLEGLGGSFAQFAAPLRNEFQVKEYSDVKKALYKYIFREYDSGEEMILGADELASIFHLPIASTDIPRVHAVKAREASPPPQLPKAGTLVGESMYRGERRPVFITDEDRRRHVYVVGQTGTGKSNLLVNMVRADIAAGKGVAVIDPHGDLVDAIISAVPPSRYGDIIVFDPGDRMYPLGLNMLEYDSRYPEQKTFIVNEMQGIFNRLFSQETMGPMFEQYMRNALLLLMEDAENEPATLMEVPRVFTDPEFRKRKLARIHNPTVVDFWEKEAVKAGGEASLANMTPYITSKFNNFIANDYMRPIIGQRKSAFNFRKCMDEGKILLVNLAKGRIGDINAGLLGMVIVGKLLMASLSRVDVPENKRRDFYLYIDEFQNFTTDSIATILSEARKYHLDLVVAHQFIAQLQEKIRDAVFGNVGSLVVFRVGATDAEFLVKQFEPTFTKSDLINIDNYNAYVKLLIGGETTPPFNIQTLRAATGSSEAGRVVKEQSRKRYGGDLRAIEEDILKRLRG
ncbi:MAG: type IV secretion system DNA-binding domain-containing protein, partial [Candidatus Harrisonbacteria bacterium]|nr:type IV secretion system DNA-binding domain-containing protein [Candidatus Harrisonbacteria bacterium]